MSEYNIVNIFLMNTFDFVKTDMYFVIAIILLVFIIFNRFKAKHENNFTCLVGKVAIVTGGNGAIGSEICLYLASRGCRVIIADINDSSQTKEKIVSLTKNLNIIVKKLDLASFKSIREFTKEIIRNEDKLDILINNAAILGSSDILTEDGLNPVMQVNYFGPFLLTHLLLDLMKKAESGRIVFTSSLAAFLYKLEPDTLSKSKKCNTWKAALEFYSKSKLATIVASDLFAKKLQGTGVTSNSLHPGVVISNLYKTIENQSFMTRKSWPFLSYIFGKNPREASKCATYLAASKEVEHLNGLFFVECRPFWKPLQTQNTVFCNEIWKISEEYSKVSLEEKIN